MRLCLISRDKRLDRLCREVLAELPAVHYEWAAQADQAPPADLYLHDVEQDPAGPAAGGEQVFLAGQEKLAALHEQRPGEGIAVLLKPVRRAALRGWLQKASERSPHGQPERQRAGRDELLQCLLLASFRLQQQSVDRGNFLARALHDFRAPLTAANGYCGMLIEQALGPLNGEQLDALRRMQRSIQRLSRLASAMFQLSLGGQMRDEPRLEPGDLAACVDQAVYEIGPAAEAREIELSVELSRTEDNLLFDRGQIEQVLVNLLENACKFSPRRAVVEVRGGPVNWTVGDFRLRAADGASYAPVYSESGENAYCVDVSDSGPGVPPERAERIFEQYVSYSGSQDRSGTGLGLATCRMILAAHHGEVFTKPRSDGATFSFVLPFLHREASGDADDRPLGEAVAAVASSQGWGS